MNLKSYVILNTPNVDLQNTPAWALAASSCQLSPLPFRRVVSITSQRVLSGLMPCLHEPKTSSFSKWNFGFPTFLGSFDYLNWILEPFQPYWSHFY